MVLGSSSSPSSASGTAKTRFPWVATPDVASNDLTKYGVFQRTFAFYHPFLAGIKQKGSEDPMSRRYRQPPPYPEELSLLLSVVGLSAGAAFLGKGLQRARLEYFSHRAEREHVLASYTKQDWYNYHQARNYRMILGFFYGGTLPAIQAGVMGAAWVALEVWTGWARDRSDFVNGAVATTLFSSVFFARGLIPVNAVTLLGVATLAGSAILGHCYLVPTFEAAYPEWRASVIAERRRIIERIEEPDGPVESLERQTQLVLEGFKRTKDQLRDTNSS